MTNADMHADTDIAGLSSAEHATGNLEARLTLVEYGDFECPRCAQAEPLTRHLVDTYGDRLRFVFRHFPDAPPIRMRNWRPKRPRRPPRKASSGRCMRRCFASPSI